MAITFTEGKSFAADLMTDLNTAILANADWTRPNSGTRPTTYKCTTTRGAQMVLDLADTGGIGTARMIVAAYTSYDGTTLGDKTGTTRYLNYKGIAAGTTATNWIYWTLSISKEHFFLMVEGPRPGEANADNVTYGSVRNYIFMCDLVPYFDSGVDPEPVVIFGATQSTSTDAYSLNSHKAYASESIGDNPWTPGNLLTLDFPSLSGSPVTTRVGPDDNYYLSPYVFFGDVDGIRGRLSHLFYAGVNTNFDTSPLSLPPVGSFVTYDDVIYKLLAVNKTTGASGNGSVQWGALGDAGIGQTSSAHRSVIVAVPHADAP